MQAFFQQNFGLPGGGLYSNLIASVLLGIIGFLYGRAFEKRAILRHRDMKAHVSAEHEKSRQHLENYLNKE